MTKCVYVSLLESSSKQGLPAVITEQATPTVSQSHFSSHRLEVQSLSPLCHVPIQLSIRPWAHPILQVGGKKGKCQISCIFSRSAASTVYPSALGADVRNSLLKQLIHIKKIPKSHLIKGNESGQLKKNKLFWTDTHPSPVFSLM